MVQASVAETTLDVQGLRLVTREAGTGPTVLYLHDELSTAWAPFLDALATSFHVIAPEMPGFGDTHRPEWIETIDDMAFFVADAADAVGPSIAVVGASLGGWLAIEAASRGAAFSKLVALGPPGIQIAGDPPTDYFFLTPEQRVELSFNDTSVAPEVSEDHVVRNESMTARLAWQPRYVSPKLAHRAHRIAAPTLVVWGADDRFLSHAHGEAMAGAIPGAGLKVVAGAGHFPALDKPAETAKLVTEFLSAP